MDCVTDRPAVAGHPTADLLLPPDGGRSPPDDNQPAKQLHRQRPAISLDPAFTLFRFQFDIVGAFDRPGASCSSTLPLSEWLRSKSLAVEAYQLIAHDSEDAWRWLGHTIIP